MQLAQSILRSCIRQSIQSGHGSLVVVMMCHHVGRRHAAEALGVMHAAGQHSSRRYTRPPSVLSEFDVCHARVLKKVRSVLPDNVGLSGDSDCGQAGPPQRCLPHTGKLGASLLRLSPHLGRAFLLLFTLPVSALRTLLVSFDPAIISCINLILYSCLSLVHKSLFSDRYSIRARSPRHLGCD